MKVFYLDQHLFYGVISLAALIKTEKHSQLSEKSFGKLRLRAFQPYHQILCKLKHVEDVKDYLRHLRHQVFKFYVS